MQRPSCRCSTMWSSFVVRRLLLRLNRGISAVLVLVVGFRLAGRYRGTAHAAALQRQSWNHAQWRFPVLSAVHRIGPGTSIHAWRLPRALAGHGPRLRRPVLVAGCGGPAIRNHASQTRTIRESALV